MVELSSGTLPWRTPKSKFYVLFFFPKEFIILKSRLNSDNIKYAYNIQ